mgnify:CR=1 FL=1
MYLLIAFVPEMLGYDEDKIINLYARKGRQERQIFQFSELLLVLEMAHNVLGLKSMKRQIFIFASWAIFVTFCVIPFYDGVRYPLSNHTTYSKLCVLSSFCAARLGNCVGRDPQRPQTRPLPPPALPRYGLP